MLTHGRDRAKHTLAGILVSQWETQSPQDWKTHFFALQPTGQSLSQSTYKTDIGDECGPI